jgi:lysine decarboxylase
MTAMQAGADMSATSIHKTSGSLTQSSAILTKGERVNYRRLITTIHLVQSTSPNALLLASLDVSRKYMYLNAENRFNEILPEIKLIRDEINKLEGLKAYGEDHFKALGATKYDETKMIIQVSGLGLSGFDAYRILSRDYQVQVELAESNIILCVFTIATTKEDLIGLYEALKKLSLHHKKEHLDIKTYRPKGNFPEAIVRPRSAYHAPSTYVNYDDAVGEIAAESVMIYPPGIPVLIPGEKISQDLIESLKFYKSQGSTILNEAPEGQIKIVDKETWPKWMSIDDEL